MAEDQVRTGRITRVVRISFAANDDSRGLYDCHGYGIIQGDDGRDVFFVDSAVQNTSFSKIESGQHAEYVLEAGPLGRAVKVWLKRCLAERSGAEQF
jgi:cold shock CspA family protein